MKSNNNIYEIPKTYTVSYFNEVEWDKNLTPEEISQREELAELIYQDQLLNGIKVGPGNDQSRTIAKVATGIAITATTIVCPPAGIGLAAGIAADGVLLTSLAIAKGDEEVTNLGIELIGMGTMGAIGGTTGLAAHAKKGCPLPLTFCKK